MLLEYSVAHCSDKNCLDHITEGVRFPSHVVQVGKVKLFIAAKNCHILTMKMVNYDHDHMMIVIMIIMIIIIMAV